MPAAPAALHDEMIVRAECAQIRMELRPWREFTRSLADKRIAALKLQLGSFARQEQTRLPKSRELPPEKHKPLLGWESPARSDSPLAMKYRKGGKAIEAVTINT
jgi:hypothetical protein